MVRATVVGSGPNGLVAAVTLARAGYEVRVREASETLGGGIRTLDGPADGYRYDVCSAVHPAAWTSPFFRAFGLREKLEWVRPEISYAHPLDHGDAAIAWRDLDRTAQSLGTDGGRWRSLLAPLRDAITEVVATTGDSMLRLPPHPLTLGRFGLRMLSQGTALSTSAFDGERASALITGVLAHANTPLPSLPSAAAGLLLAAQAHADGWMFPRGGAQRIADALCDDIRAHGGVFETGQLVDDLRTLDWGDAGAGDLLILNASPRLLRTLPDLPTRYGAALSRYRYGPAAAKVDFALDGPVPWRNADVAQASTVHLGGTREEIWHSENTVARGAVSEQPYVLAVQPSVADDTRAPAGGAALWTYVHVPLGSTCDPTERIIRQVERFAPGFRDRIIAHRVVRACEREGENPSEIGGDVLGGAFTLRQALARPVLSRTPWRTPARGVYLASAATAPGPGVNGMAGWHAARTALADAGEPASLAELFS